MLPKALLKVMQGVWQSAVGKGLEFYVHGVGFRDFEGSRLQGSGMLLLTALGGVVPQK